MIYKDYKGCTKTYVIVHNQGSGATGEPYRELEVVYETDDYNDAKNKALELENKYNTPAEIQSTWLSNTFIINVNLLSEGGKKLLNTMSYNKEKLPLGLLPRYIYEDYTKSERYSEIIQAISRFLYAKKKINILWIEEYNELTEYFEKQGKGKTL
jgi:hypothetical protein